MGKCLAELWYRFLAWRDQSPSLWENVAEAPDKTGMRRFTLERTEDVSGVSGVGTVAEGIEFTDETAVIRWTVGLKSTAVYNTIDELIAIHGHDRRTTVRWIDNG